MRCKNVLIVEDNEGIREGLKEALTVEDFEVYCVKNGREGLMVLKRLKASSLVLLDLMMPVMDGWSFLDQMKRDPALSDRRVVVMTCLGVTKALTPGGGIEPVAYIQKPFQLDRMLELVEEYCERKNEARYDYANLPSNLSDDTQTSIGA